MTATTIPTGTRWRAVAVGAFTPQDKRPHLAPLRTKLRTQIQAGGATARAARALLGTLTVGVAQAAEWNAARGIVPRSSDTAPAAGQEASQAARQAARQSTPVALEALRPPTDPPAQVVRAPRAPSALGLRTA